MQRPSSARPPDTPPVGTYSGQVKSALGGSPDEYRAYAAGIRGEYEEHYGLAAFTSGRAKVGTGRCTRYAVMPAGPFETCASLLRVQVLRSFLARAHLCYTEYGRSHLEVKARQNLSAELAQLDAEIVRHARCAVAQHKSTSIRVQTLRLLQCMEARAFS